MPKPKIWFVSPCFFDVESFKELRRRCLDVVHKCLPDLEPKFVVIDDSGGQDSQAIELDNGPSTTVLVSPYNIGHQSAIVFALRSILPYIDPMDYIVTLDCDGEDKPEDIPLLIESLITKPDDLYAVVLAQRTKRSETLKFKTLYFFFKIFFSLLTGTNIKSGNLAAFRGQFINGIIFHPYFDYCYSSSLVALPLKRKNISLARGSRYFGKSKMTLISLVGHGFRMLLPFSELIAIRGLILSGGLVLLGVVSLLFTIFLCKAYHELYGWLITIEILACFFSIFVFIVSFVFFATFHQTRAISMRNWSGFSSGVGFKSS